MYRDIYTYVTEDCQTERILMNAYVVVGQAYYNIDTLKEMYPYGTCISVKTTI